MTSDSELRNVSESLKVTLFKAQRYGVNIDFQQLNGPPGKIQIWIDPLTVCPECMEWSLSDRCLWCKPDDFGGAGVA